MKNTKEIKLRIIEAGYKAVDELIKVAEESVVKKGEEDNGDELAADKLKNAAATKKLAIFDAFEILSRIESEKETIEASERGTSRTDTKQGFAERRSRQ
ncbi:MAG: hypothetical protein ACK5DE_03895 [Bacteroidota bacterium]|jgi:hypothetical protein